MGWGVLVMLTIWGLGRVCTEVGGSGGSCHVSCD